MSPPLTTPQHLVAVPTTDVEEMIDRGEGPVVVHRFGDVTIIRLADPTIRPGSAEVEALRTLSDPMVLPRDELIAHLDLAAFAYRRRGELQRRARGVVTLMSAVVREAAVDELPSNAAST